MTEPSRDASAAVRRGPDSVPLAHYATVLRRSARLLIILTVLGGVVGLAVVLVSPATYVATVSVLAPAEPLHVGAAGKTMVTRHAPRESTLDTEAQFVYSDEVLTRLATVTGLVGDRAVLRRSIEITAPSNTRILQIKVRAAQEHKAKLGAEATAQAYLKLRQEVIGEVQKRNRQALERKADLLDKQVHALNTGRDVTLTRLTARSRRQVLQQQQSEVQRQLHALDGRAVQPGEMLRGEHNMAARDTTGHDVIVTTGAAAGLLVGLGIALIRMRRPRPIRKTTDIPPAIAAPILAEADAGDAGLRNACRRLRNMIFDEEAGMVLVCGHPIATAEVVAHELAGLCVEGGMKTTLLRVETDELTAVPPPVADTPYRIFTTKADDGDRGLALALEKARTSGDLLIVTGLVPEGADTVGVAAACDLTYVVVERDRTVDRELLVGVRALETAACPPHGLVLT